METGVRDQHAADRRTNHGTNLENAAVPRYRVGESIARNKGRKKRAACCPTKCANCRREKKQKINERNGRIIEMKSGMVAFENRRDRR